jgi:hypothetical protein
MGQVVASASHEVGGNMPMLLRVPLFIAPALTYLCFFSVALLLCFCSPGSVVFVAASAWLRQLLLSSTPTRLFSSLLPAAAAAMAAHM